MPSLLRALAVVGLSACSLRSATFTGADASDAPLADSDGTPDDAEVVPGHVVVYVGGTDNRIYSYDFDVTTGVLSPIENIASFGPGPSFLTSNGKQLFVVSEASNRVASYTINQTTGRLVLIKDSATGGTGPAHVTVDPGNQNVLVTNYGSGTVASLRVSGIGEISQAITDMETAGTNAHEVVLSPSSTIALVPCKGTGVIQRYLYDVTTGALSLVTPAAASLGPDGGPRHLAFDVQGTHAYVIGETGSILWAFNYAATGELSLINSISSRAPSMTGTNTGAEVAVLGDAVYVSNRGDNTIGLFHIDSSGGVSLVTHVGSGGMTPRHFAIDPTGRWLIVANQGSSTLATFRIDPTTRMLTLTHNPLTPTGSYVVAFAVLP